MRYEENAQVFNFLSGVVLGAMVGAGVALLMAPQSGRRTRRRIRRAAGDLKHSAADRWDEVADEVRDRVDETVHGARKHLPT